MRRAVEVVLVVIVLIAVPVGVGVVARSEPSPGPPQLSALAFAKPILAYTHFTARSCAWTDGRADIACALKGGGTCAFKLSAHSGKCSEEKGESSESVTFSWDEPAP